MSMIRYRQAPLKTYWNTLNGRKFPQFTRPKPLMLLLLITTEVYQRKVEFLLFTVVLFVFLCDLRHLFVTCLKTRAIRCARDVGSKFALPRFTVHSSCYLAASPRTSYTPKNTLYVRRSVSAWNGYRLSWDCETFCNGKCCLKTLNTNLTALPWK